MQFAWNLLIMFIVALVPLAIYAMKRSSSLFQWRILFTDNLFRFIGAGVLITALSFIITYVKELEFLSQLLSTSGFVVGTASAGGLGLAIGVFLVKVLPSDTGLKESIGAARS